MSWRFLSSNLDEPGSGLNAISLKPGWNTIYPWSGRRSARRVAQQGFILLPRQIQFQLQLKEEATFSRRRTCPKITGGKEEARECLYYRAAWAAALQRKVTHPSGTTDQPLSINRPGAGHERSVSQVLPAVTNDFLFQVPAPPLISNESWVIFCGDSFACGWNLTTVCFS